MSNNSNISKLPLGLMLVRYGVVLFMLPWILMKFTAPSSTTGIFEKYYHISGVGNEVSYAIGAVMLAVLIAFAVGFKKRISYGLIMLFHGVSTVMTIPYLIPYTEKFIPTFMAAIPTLAALILLYMMRDHDTKFTIGK